MKKLTTISLIIFSIITTAILTAGLVFYQNNKNNAPALNNSGSNSPIGAKTTPGITLNMAEIAKHNSITDCWMIINNKVYNVSSYLFGHPGGAGSMMPYCGKEATRAFDTKDRNRPHSSYANSLLANYYVGDLNQTVTGQPIQTNAQNTNSVAPPSQGGGYGGFDD